MSDLITNLENLTPEELKRVANLIEKFTKRKTVDNQQTEDIIKEEPKAKQKSTKVTQGRSAPRNPVNKKNNNVRRKGSRGGGAGRTESVVLSNENKFEKMRDRNSFKDDAKIDKKLWGDRQPTERPEEFEFVEVQCKECGKWYDINPTLIYVDQDTREVNFTCDNCVPRGN